jgi:hypothetical protein
MISQTESPWSQETIARRKTTIQAKSWNQSPLQKSGSDFGSLSFRAADPNASSIFPGEEESAGNAESFTGSEVMRDSYLNTRNPNSKHNPRRSLVSLKMQTTKTILVAGLQSVTGTLDLSCSTNSKIKMGKITVRVDGTPNH